MKNTETDTACVVLPNSEDSQNTLHSLVKKDMSVTALYTEAQIRDALSFYFESKGVKRKFAFSSGGTLYSVPVDQICCFQSDGRKVTLCTAQSHYTFYAKLNDVAEDPALSEFIRCHQSFLLNPDFVERISGKLVSLSGGMELAISKGYYEKVKSSYLRYLSKISQ